MPCIVMAMRSSLAGLAAVVALLLAYAATDDDLRPVVTTKKHVAQERIQAARDAINATAPAPCTATRMK